MFVRAYSLRSVVDAEVDSARGRGSGGEVTGEVIHGEARKLPCDFKHVELGAAGERPCQWGSSDGDTLEY